MGDELTQDTTYGGPFGQAAHIYRSAGWNGTLPLGDVPGRKYPPPGNRARGVTWTGHGAPFPGSADIAAWLETHADRNIGLRLPPGVIGLDVDAYAGKRGAEELERLIGQWGPLPPTWITTARTDGVSGIRLYRVPLTLDGRPINWPGEAGKHIEIIQTGHRYAVVWPSTNPEAGGAQYRWSHPSTFAVDLGAVPLPGDLPELPETWVRGLALAYDRADKAEIGTGALSAWWEQLRTGDPCPAVHRVCTKAVDDLRDVDGSRHETARDAIASLVRFGGAGHRGVPHAVNVVRAAFADAVGEERMANGEWHRLLAGAVQIAAGENPTPQQHCEHDPATRLELPAGFTMPGPAGAPPSVAPTGPGADDLIASIAALPADERDATVLAAAEQLAEAPEAEQQAARAQLTTRGGMSGVTLGTWDAIVRDARKRAKETREYQAKLAAHQEARQRIDDLKARGSILPPPHAPIDVARELAAQLPAPAKWWRGDYYRWDGTRYVLWRDEAVDNWLYVRTADASYDAGEEKGPAPWRPTEAKITGVSHALSRGVLYRPSEDETHDNAAQVACANGVYDVATEQLLPHDPERFNLSAVPFAYDPAADAPTWQWFLNDVLPADAQQLLQEWFGYIISGRSDMEKLLHMQGLPRSGKGTTAWVLGALLGEENVASPSIPSLVGTFGEQPLIGKSLAIMSDVTWQHRDIVTGVEILKAIVGRDARDVNRKNRDAWHGRLGVRFMIMGNDLPKFTDASGALAHRMLHIQFPGTVMGRENPALKGDLLKELPGILNWALAGLRRLVANGTFTAPQSSEALASEVRRQQGPAQAFLDDTCAYTEAAAPVPLDELYPVYRAWARDAGVEHALNREHFSRALTSSGLAVKRERVNGVRTRRVYGIAPTLDDAGRTSWVALLNPLAVPPVG